MAEKRARSVPAKSRLVVFEFRGRCLLWCHRRKHSLTHHHRRGDTRQSRRVFAKVWFRRTSYATSPESNKIIPSKKSTVRPWPFRNHSNCFWKIEKPVLTSCKIAFNLDLVVGVSHPHELNFTELVPWSTVAMLWPCRKTFEQFVNSLYSTWVFDKDQFPLLEIAKFICLSIFLIE